MTLGLDALKFAMPPPLPLPKFVLKVQSVTAGLLAAELTIPPPMRLECVVLFVN
jgi:hypothetical protein